MKNPAKTNKTENKPPSEVSQQPPETNVPGNTRTVDDFVKSYKQFGKQSAENIVKQARIVVQAKDQLYAWEFRQFLEEVGLVEDGATHKKIRVIGENYHRFEPFIDRLPNSWTTLYKLASLAKKNPDAFKRVTESEPFCSSMRADDIETIIGKQAKKKKVREKWKIDLSSLGEKAKVELYLKLESLKAEYAFELKDVNETIVATANNITTSTTSSVLIGTAPAAITINPAAKEG